jgi:maltose alpha-D-glucosyltransferase/alpha-amylase
LALAHANERAEFAPEPFSRLYQRGLYQSMRSQARATFELLRSRLGRLPDEGREVPERALAAEGEILSRYGRLLGDRIDAQRIRCHGDYHLGQVLFTGKDFIIIDFEGEPERPVSERRIKASPLRDVAGMLRSYHYAAHAALRGANHALVIGHSAIPAERWANFWSMWSSAAFLGSYLDAAREGGFLPASKPQLDVLLGAFVFEKALYELRYELNNRPDWVKIPLEGILQLLE